MSVGISQWCILRQWAGRRSLLWLFINPLARSAAGGSIAWLIERDLGLEHLIIGSLMAEAIAIIPPSMLIFGLIPAYRPHPQ